jgi:predicted dehydrogenase
MRAMVKRGDLGAIRLIKAQFAHGFHADEADADNPRVRWRYDPKLAGISAQFADCGIHALQMASYVSGQDARELSADFVSCLKSRTLEDDALVNFRMDGGAVLRLWTSSIAVGSMHGLNIRVFGEKGGLGAGMAEPAVLDPARRPHRDFGARRSESIAGGRPRLARHHWPRRRHAAGLRQPLFRHRRSFERQTRRQDA